MSDENQSNPRKKTAADAAETRSEFVTRERITTDDMSETFQSPQQQRMSGLREDRVEAPEMMPPELAVDRNTGSSEMLDRGGDRIASGSDVTGGDMQSETEQAKVVGEEAIGGTTPTPDQSITEANAASAGIAIPDRKPIQTEDMLNRRDDSRWELDPKSSEDYDQHNV